MYNDEEIKQIFAARLKGLREAAGLTQGELAAKLGVSRGSISFYEQCQRVPDIIFLDRVSSYFRVSVSFLMGYSENLSAKTEALELTLDFTDETIEKLINTQTGYALSVFIEHERFEDFMKCAEYYLIPVLTDEHYDSETDFDFRTFQIATMLTGILADLKADLIKYYMERFGGEIDTVKYKKLLNKLNRHVKASDQAFANAEPSQDEDFEEIIFSEDEEGAMVYKKTRQFVQESDEQSRKHPSLPDSELLKRYRDGHH